MSYYWFNRKELLEKSHKKYDKEGGKERAGEYYDKNKETVKKKARNKNKNLSKEEKEKKRQYSKNKYNKLKQQYRG